MNIKLQNVSKGYEKEVIKSIDLNINAYNTVAIIGKSGCGKSTLLRLMTAIESVDSGLITINNNEVNKDIKKDRKKSRDYQDQISMVFQEHNLFPHLTLLENISLILEKRKKMDAVLASKRAKEMLTKLHLSGEMHKKPRFVSGGQAQRASIARALATDPEIVFMDEPTASLDPLLTKEVLHEVLELKKTGTKFVFVTHELDFVKKFADYVIFMDEGKLIEDGEVDILSNPKTDMLKEFLMS